MLGNDTPASSSAPSESQKPAPVVAPAKSAATTPPAAPKPAAATPAPKADAVAPKPGTEGPKELRAELTRLQTELKTRDEKIAATEARIAEAEKRGKDTEALNAVLEQHKKELEQARGELRAFKKEASPEFIERYKKPFDQAADNAERVLRTIPRADGTQADFKKDFSPLYYLAQENYVAAADKAAELFGERGGNRVMSMIDNLTEKNQVMETARAEEQKNWQERQKLEEGQRIQEAERAKANWAKINEDLAQSVEDYRDPVDDKEISAARAKGIELFDSQPRTQQEAMVKGAHIRHRLGAFGAQQLTIQRQIAEIASLKEQLAAHQDNPPGDDIHKPGGAEVAAPEADAWDVNTVKREVEKR